MSEDLELAHKHSIFHRKEIETSELCGCLFCRETFAPSKIEGWTDGADGKQETALCPVCNIDSVIGDQSGFPIFAPEFLKRMNVRWFS